MVRMVDQLISVQSDNGWLEPTPVTIVQNGAMVDFSAIGSGGGGASDPAVAQRLGATTSPEAGTVNANLALIKTTLGNPLQAGATVPVTGAFFQATQPISATALPLPTGAATDATVATLLKAGQSIGISNFPATQAVSAASLPLPSGAATDATTASLFKAGQSIGNITGTVTLPTGAATAAGVAAIVSTLGSPLQANGNVAVTNFPATQAVSVASLPLPAGAATAAGIAALATPMPDYEDQRVFDGFGFTVSSLIVAVSAGNYLITELANPAGSGVNYIITSRSFGDNVVGGNAPLEYARYSTASTLSATPTPTSVTVNNRLTGGPATTATFRYQMGATLPTGGTISSSGFIPTNGEELRIKDIVIIAPGTKMIYAVGGSGGGLATTARIKMTILFYTRPI